MLQSALSSSYDMLLQDLKLLDQFVAECEKLKEEVATLQNELTDLAKLP